MTEEFIEYLNHDEVVANPELERALDVANSSGEPLSHVLAQLGLVAPDRLANILCQAYSLNRLDSANTSEFEFSDLSLNTAFLKSCRAVPLMSQKRVGQTIIAIANPDSTYVQDALRFAVSADYETQVATEDEIADLIEQLVESQDNDTLEDNVGWMASDLERLKELASDAPVVRYVDRLIDSAVAEDASDIHIEPLEDRYQTRVRLDGVLREVSPPPSAIAAAVVSRLKIMAQLDIAERRLPQDGRIRHRAHGRQLDFRVSTIPTAHGEAVVLRLLDKGQLTLDFPRLGFAKRHCAYLTKSIERPDGIVLTTGPTGSGKTTTLYAALTLLNTEERKILSVEDPIEYTINGVSQVQVDARIGRTFAATLRSFLRQDPDVIMVGEIRDGETASIAIQAALTGHLVLSTLHTRSAAATITRLVDMGIDPYLISSTLRSIVAQRLVRVLCQQCRVPSHNSDTFAEIETLGDGVEIYEAGSRGCEACHGSGYSSRTVIAEVMPVGAAMRAAILSGADADTLQQIAEQQGLVPLYEDGLNKVRNGITTLDEVHRVTADA